MIETLAPVVSAARRDARVERRVAATRRTLAELARRVDPTPHDRRSSPRPVASARARVALVAANRRRRIDLPARRRDEGNWMDRDTLGPCALFCVLGAVLASRRRCRASGAAAAAPRRRASQPTSIVQDEQRSSTRTPTTASATSRLRVDDTTLFADEAWYLRRREARRRHRQRRLHSRATTGSPPIAPRSTRRRGSACSTTPAGLANIQPPRQSARRSAASSRRQLAGQDTDVYFFGETVEKIGPKKYKITNGGFTTCVQPTPRWNLNAGRSC